MFNWTIDNLDRRTSDDFITTAHWRCTAVDGGFSASVYGSCGWGNGTPIIPYSEVTQEQVLEWCWNTNIDKTEMENNLINQIEKLKNPETKAGVPW